jgi:hypothetical protein
MKDYIVYWIGDRVYVDWVSKKQAKEIVANPETKVTTWLKA